MGEAPSVTGYINLADTTTPAMVARTTTRVAVQPHLCVMDARLLTCLNVVALLVVGARILYLFGPYEALFGPYTEESLRSLAPYACLFAYLGGMLSPLQRHLQRHPSEAPSPSIPEAPCTQAALLA